MGNEAEVQVQARVSRALYARILEKQKEAKKLTGIEPSTSAVVRALLEAGLDAPKKR